MQNGPQYEYYLQTYLSMTSGNWVTKLYILGLSLYFIVALTAQRFPFPAYKPTFRPGLFAFSAFVTQHNSLARETAYLLSPKKKLSQSWQKKIFPLRGIPIGKPFLDILRFKNNLRLLQPFEQTIEQPQEGTFPFAAIFVYLHYRAVRRLNTRKPINQSDKSPLCWHALLLHSRVSHVIQFFDSLEKCFSSLEEVSFHRLTNFWVVSSQFFMLGSVELWSLVPCLNSSVVFNPPPPFY